MHNAFDNVPSAYKAEGDGWRTIYNPDAEEVYELEFLWNHSSNWPNYA